MPEQTGIPAFLEVEPGSFKPIDACTDDELETHWLSVMMRARAALDDADALRLYITGRWHAGQP